MQKRPRTRLYVSGAGLSSLSLDDSESLGIRRSLRLQVGDCTACFNGDGYEYIYEITESSRYCLTLVKQSSRPNPCDETPQTTVFIAATKGKTKDRIVRDLPPLGITRIIFYHADRSVCRPQTDAQSRLEKIAIEACRQCGRSTIPEIIIAGAPLRETFENQQISPRQTLLFWEQSNPSNDWKKNEYKESAALIFGPEGGFSDEETAWFQSQQLPIASLGKRILRTELAVVTGTVLLQEHRGLIE